ncbi:hypothetical protein PoB_006344100 [Plakobranchus ocellatus]|uniref:Uncharacterized protein n=1 Tax=Plakobranchus ocellatus TaxID=259542 RepID=A0AAV4CYP8_9GAST|nr:hypothetical protein PoB_006344100 [Plakobranchus ocellatus]
MRKPGIGMESKRKTKEHNGKMNWSQLQEMGNNCTEVTALIQELQSASQCTGPAVEFDLILSSRFHTLIHRYVDFIDFNTFRWMERDSGKIWRPHSGDNGESFSLPSEKNPIISTRLSHRTPKLITVLGKPCHPHRRPGRLSRQMNYS